MKTLRLLLVLVFMIGMLCVSLFLAIAAGASPVIGSPVTITQVSDPAPNIDANAMWHTPQYHVYGNFTYADCTVEADANLVRKMFPNAPITTDQVVAAWQTYYPQWGADTGLDFLTSVGFDGHTIVASTPITTRSQLIAAARSGGAYALVFDGTHAVAIVNANAKGLELVNGGWVYQVLWSQWLVWQPTQVLAVTWSKS